MLAGTYKHRKEILVKLSKSHKGQHSSPKTEFKKGLIPWNKGMVDCYSECIKKKMSDARVGIKLSKETKIKIGNAHRGKKNHNFGKHWKLSEAVKNKIRESRKGKSYISVSGRIKLSGLHKGKKCIFWRGGVNPENMKIRGSLDSHLWRDQVFRRDKYICQMPECNKIERYLNAHHIKKFSDFPELRFEVSNGITLCEKCHNKTKGKENKFENIFVEIIKTAIKGGDPAISEIFYKEKREKIAALRKELAIKLNW